MKVLEANYEAMKTKADASKARYICLVDKFSLFL